ncbi:MAG: hypothetical protein LBN96_01600 [Desulfovibrio sp.]|nr:hypothetical protein [Desulfovibrio sp.]
MREFFARHILDWENIFNANGEPLPCTYENKIKVLGAPELSAVIKFLRIAKRIIHIFQYYDVSIHSRFHPPTDSGPADRSRVDCNTLPCGGFWLGKILRRPPLDAIPKTFGRGFCRAGFTLEPGTISNSVHGLFT